MPLDIIMPVGVLLDFVSRSNHPYNTALSFDWAQGLMSSKRGCFMARFILREKNKKQNVQ